MFPSREFSKRLLIPLAASGAFLFSLACASGLPAVISSTPDEVAIEFDKEKTVASTREIATESCASHQKIAQFDAVNRESTERSRIAMYSCVPPEGQLASDAEAKTEAAQAAAEAEIRGEAEATRAAVEAMAKAERAIATPALSASSPSDTADAPETDDIPDAPAEPTAP